MKQIPALIESLSIAKSRILKDRDQKSNDLRQSDDEVAKDLDEVMLFIKGLDKGPGPYRVVCSNGLTKAESNALQGHNDRIQT